MAKKLSSKALKKLDMLTEARRKWDRVRGLVELLATQRMGHDLYLGQIRRTSQDVQRVFMNAGLGPLADGANQMVLQTRRGGTLQNKLRGMREVVVAVSGGIERAEKAVVDEDQESPEE